MEEKVLISMEFDDLDCLNTALMIAMITIKGNPKVFGEKLKEHVGRIWDNLTELQNEYVDANYKKMDEGIEIIDDNSYD